MPKWKRKNKSGGHVRQQQDSNFASEEESLADNCSIASNLSELRLESDEEPLNEVEDDVTDDFEDKLKEAIEGTLQKSAKGRVSCLNLIIKSLTTKYMFDFLSDRIITMSDVVERSLKRGKGEEQILGANVAALLCTHLGYVDESATVFQSLQPFLHVLLTDPTAAPAVRAQCASSLGLCCFISCPGPEVIQSTMDSLHSVFSGSFFKGNGVVPTVKPEISSLHSSALLAWTLLLTVLSPPYIMDLVKSHLRKLPQLLESVDVDLRIAAGESLAVFYELGRQCREDFVGYDIDGLCEKLRLLATDSQKFRAKKDRRQQRSSFRDILSSIEEQEPLDIRVKIGKEILYIDTWCHKRQYDAFCQILSSGMNLHLKQNDLLRDIFELGAPIIEVNQTSKNSKLQRHSAHLAAFKARTKYMNKLRDKRADII